MSQVKRLMEQQEEQRIVATRIAVEAGVLRRCRFHDCVFDPQNFDHKPAYKLANYRFTKGLLKDVFDDRSEMNDAIKAAIQDAAMDCYECDRMRSDD